MVEIKFSFLNAKKMLMELWVYYFVKIKVSLNLQIIVQKNKYPLKNIQTIKSVNKQSDNN